MPETGPSRGLPRTPDSCVARRLTCAAACVPAFRQSQRRAPSLGESEPGQLEHKLEGAVVPHRRPGEPDAGVAAVRAQE